MHIHVYTHMHTQAPLAAKESEAADKLRCLTSQLDAEAQVFMRLRTCTHTHAHAHARAYAHVDARANTAASICSLPHTHTCNPGWKR